MSIPKARELLTITHNTNAIFEYASATLKPGARHEIKRTAHMISLYPNRDVHIQISLNDCRFMGSDHIYEMRVQTIMDILLKQGIDMDRVHRTPHRPVSAFDAKDTISMAVMDRPVAPLPWIKPQWQQEGPSYCQAC